MKRIILIFSALFFTFAIGFSQNPLSNMESSIEPKVEYESAIYGVADNAEIMRSYGVRGYTNGIDGIGVLGTGRTGVYGQGGDYGVIALGNVQAGRFLGDVEYTGMLIGPSSDAKLKTFLKDETSYLALLSQMDIRKYKYKTTEFPSLNLSDRVQYGLVAQELEKFMPELVFQSKTVTSPLKEKSNTPSLEYKTINYMGLVPVALSCIKEIGEQVNFDRLTIEDQYIKIEELSRQVEELAKQVEVLKKK